jgi:hypothetical protein
MGLGHTFGKCGLNVMARMHPFSDFISNIGAGEVVDSIELFESACQCTDMMSYEKGKNGG